MLEQLNHSSKVFYISYSPAVIFSNKRAEGGDGSVGLAGGDGSIGLT